MYRQFNIKLYKKYYLWNRFLFTHTPLEDEIQLNGCDYVFSGHLNPGIMVDQKSGVSEILPCFYFTQKQCVLPVFGDIPDKKLINNNSKERVFVIAKRNDEDIVLKYDKPKKI